MPATWAKQSYQGDTFEWTFAVKQGDVGSETPVNLIGVTITMTIKKVRGAGVAVLWTGSTTDGAITIGGAGNNVITIIIPAVDTAGIPFGSWIYDIQFVEGATVRTYLTGSFTVTAEVTQ